MAKFFEAPDEGRTQAVAVQPIKVIRAKIVVGLAIEEQVPDHLQQSIRHGHQSAFFAAMSG